MTITINKTRSCDMQDCTDGRGRGNHCPTYHLAIALPGSQKWLSILDCHSPDPLCISCEVLLGSNPILASAACQFSSTLRWADPVIALPHVQRLPAALRLAVAVHQSTAVLWLVRPEANWWTGNRTNLDWLKNAINDLACHMIHRITSSAPTTWFYIQGIGQGYRECVVLK